MRALKFFFLPLCFCILTLTVGLNSFAGNGVERGSRVLEWDDLASVVHKDVQVAVENSIKAEAPQMLRSLNGKQLIVDSLRVVGGNSGLIDQGNSIIELTLRLSSDDVNRFKVRMSMESPQGFMNHDGRMTPGVVATPAAKVLEWIGLNAVFGTDFGLKNVR